MLRQNKTNRHEAVTEVKNSIIMFRIKDTAVQGGRKTALN